jgi:hypothetical protein
MNSPKQKAEELFEKMLYNDGDKYHHCSHYVGKNCAIIAIDEVLKYSKAHGFIALTEEYQQIKNEIEKI